MITNTLASVATPHEWTVVGGDKDYDNFDYLPSFSINRAGIILCKYTNYEHFSFKKYSDKIRRKIEEEKCSGAVNDQDK